MSVREYVEPEDANANFIPLGDEVLPTSVLPDLVPTPPPHRQIPAEEI